MWRLGSNGINNSFKFNYCSQIFLITLILSTNTKKNMEEFLLFEFKENSVIFNQFTTSKIPSDFNEFF